MIKQLINFYLFRKFKIPEIDRKNMDIAEQYGVLMAKLDEYQDRHHSLMSHLIVKDPNLYNNLVAIESLARDIDYLSYYLEVNLDGIGMLKNSGILF